MALLLRFLPHLIVVAIVGILLAIVYGRGVSNERNRQEAKIAKLEASWAEERAKAAEETATQERLFRAIEQEMHTKVNDLEAIHAANVIVLEERVRKLDGTRQQLLGNISNLVKTGSPTTSSGSACGDLQDRLATCGSLYQRTDEFAQRCSVDYSKVRDAWDTCAGYAKVVSTAVH